MRIAGNVARIPDSPMGWLDPAIHAGTVRQEASRRNLKGATPTTPLAKVRQLLQAQDKRRENGQALLERTRNRSFNDPLLEHLFGGGRKIRVPSSIAFERARNKVPGAPKIGGEWDGFERAMFPGISDKLVPVISGWDHIDSIAQEARHVLQGGAEWTADSDADYTMDDFWQDLARACKNEAEYKEHARQEELEARQYERFEKDALSARPGTTPVPVETLEGGDKLNVNGVELKVENVTPDGTVTLSDGNRYGEQVVQDGQTLHAEVVSTRAENEAAEKAGLPDRAALAAMSKPQLAGQMRREGLAAPDSRSLAMAKKPDLVFRILSARRRNGIAQPEQAEGEGDVPFQRGATPGGIRWQAGGMLESIQYEMEDNGTEPSVDSLLDEWDNARAEGAPRKDWPLIPADQYRNALRRFMRDGDRFVFPERILRGWLRLCTKNLMEMSVITGMAGHDTWDATPEIEDHYNGDAADFDLDAFIDWARLPEGSTSVSDYGLAPIYKILDELDENATSGQMIVALNRILDVMHMNGDLSAAFIEGGTKTLSRISNDRTPLFQKGAPTPEERAEAKRQYDAVVARYTNPDGTKKPGWRKAPNGQKSRLDERAWVQTRTENFKRWFGDWESLAEATLQNHANSYAEGRALVDALVDQELESADGLKATISRGSVDKIFSGKSVKKSVSVKAHLAAAANIGQLFSKAVELKTEPGNKAGVKQMHRLYTPFLFEGKPLVAKLSVKEFIHAADGAPRLYTIESMEVETAAGDLVPKQTENGESNPTQSSLETLRKMVAKVNPDSVSKAVDENGEPLVVYHGTKGDFTEFSDEKVGSNLDYGRAGRGFYFTTDRENAENYARNAGGREDRRHPRVIAAFLNVRNPKEGVGATQLDGSRRAADAFTNRAKAKGHDGIHAVHGYGMDRLDWYIAFDPNQIKSATDNVGTFSDRDDMRFQRGAEASPFRLEQQTPEQIAAEAAAAKRLQKQQEAERAREAAREAKAEAGRRQQFDDLHQGLLDIGLPGETGSLFAPRQRTGGGTGTLFQRGTAPSADWSTATIPELRRELVRRGLSPSGSAAALRRRLEETDRRQAEAEDGGIRWQKASPTDARRLEGAPKVRVYRAMQMVDGKLYPPMAAKVGGKWVDPTEPGTWYVADEHPELAMPVIDKKTGKQKVDRETGRPVFAFKLDKGNSSSITAAYNPYWHTSRTPLNDQFSSASKRPELVIVECEVPESELSSGYRAEKAKDTVGEKDWHSGPVSSWLAEHGQRRKVILSRYSKVVRVVPDAEVAAEVRRMLDGTDISIPESVVTPALRAELERLGVDISRQARSAYSWDKLAKDGGKPRTMAVPRFTRGAFAQHTPRKDMVESARKSVRQAGGRDTPGGLVLDIPAFGEVVVVGRSGIEHGLHYRTRNGGIFDQKNADILPSLGAILKNSVPVNELMARPKDPKGVTGATVLLGAAMDDAGALVPVVSVVDHVRHEKPGLPEIRVFPLKSVNAKNPQRATGLPPDAPSAGFSEINLADLVGQIKDQVPIFSKDVYDHFKQERPVGDFSNLRFQRGSLYTGSAADYANRRPDGAIENGPSLQHIGTGEGSQVYGWGLYASDRRGVAQSYAKNDAKFKSYPRVFVDGEEVASNPYSVEISVRDEIYEALRGEDFDKAKGEARLDRIIEQEEGLLRDPWFGQGTYAAERRKRVQNLREALNLMRSGRVQIQKNQASPYLYEQTFFTNRATPEETERHLLKWYEPVSDEQLEWIDAQLAKEKIAYFWFRDFFRKPTGEKVYEGIQKLFRGKGYRETPKLASEFLARAGIDGVKYPVNSYGGKSIKDGDTAGWNYVSFRDDNIRVDHKWRDGEQLFQRGAPPSRDWSTATIPELRRELVRRGLSPSGSAAALRRRLEETDRRQVEAEDGGIRWQRADEHSRAALADIASGKEYGVLHNPVYGEIRYPLGRMGRKGTGFLHIVEHRMNGGADMDTAIETAIRVGVAAEIGKETFSKFNTRHLDVDGTRAIIAIMPDNTAVLTGYEIDADETAAANRRAAELSPHPHVSSDEIVKRLKERFAPPSREVKPDDGSAGDLHFQKGADPQMRMFNTWDNAHVELQARKRGHEWHVVAQDGTDLGRYATQQSAEFALARERSMLEAAGDSLSKLKKAKIAEIAEARRKLVELIRKADSTKEERADAIAALGRALGLHPDLAAKEWKVAESILRTHDPESTETAAERAERIVNTVLARASIKLHGRDMMRLVKQKAGGKVTGGLRKNKLLPVVRAWDLIRENMTADEKARRLDEMASAIEKEEKLLDSGEGKELTPAELDARITALAEKKNEMELLAVFGGLATLHGGESRARLAEDARAWADASAKMATLTDKAVQELKDKLIARATEAKATRDQMIHEVTGGHKIPESEQERQAAKNARGWRARAAEFVNGLVAQSMGGGTAWGEMITRDKSVAFGQSTASHLFHDGLAAGYKAEMEANEADRREGLRILASSDYFENIDPNTDIHQLIDFSEKCETLFNDEAVDEHGNHEITVRSCTTKGKGKDRTTSYVTGGPCTLKLGELMHFYIIGLQAEEAAGQAYTDQPKHLKGCDTSLMTALVKRGFATETMMEIRAALQKRGLDTLALAISADMEKKGDALDALMAKEYNSQLRRVHPYAPLRRLHWGLTEQGDADGGGVGSFMSMVRSFLKERVANDRDFKTVNLIESWQSHNRQANHIIHLHDWISTVGRVMRHADMQTALDFTVGDKTRRALNAWLDIQARGGSMVIRDDDRFGLLARNFAVAVTTNPRVALKQLTSPGMALGMLPEGASTLDWFKDMAEIAFPGQARRDFLAFLDGNSPEWRERGLNASDALQLINRHKAGDKFELLRLKVQRKLGAMTRWGDRNGALLGCYGVFRAWERKLAAEGMDPAAAKIAALEKFVESVNAGQQSTLPEYVSKVQTMGGLYKYMSMFHTAQIAMTRNIYTHAKAWLEGRGSRREHARAIAGVVTSAWAFRLMGMGMLPLAQIILGLLQGDKDKLKTGATKTIQEGLLSIVEAPCSGILPLGDALVGLAERNLKRDAWGRTGNVDVVPQLTVLANIDRIVSDFRKKADNRDWLAVARHASDFIGQITGIPVTPAIDAISGTADAWTAPDLTPEQRVARQLTFSRSAIGAPKRKPPVP